MHAAEVNPGGSVIYSICLRKKKKKHLVRHPFDGCKPNTRSPRAYNGNKPDRLVITLKSATVSVSIIHKFLDGGAPVSQRKRIADNAEKESDEGKGYTSGVMLCNVFFLFINTRIQLARR